jgi:MFS family permease
MLLLAANISILIIGKKLVSKIRELPTPQSWIVVFSGALFFFYDFIQLNMFNALNAPLIKEFQVTAVQLGQLSAFYFYAVIPLLFPAGIILDRVSTRKLILMSMSLMVSATLLFAMAHQFWVTALCRFLTGVGGTFCLLSAVRLASRWFPPRRMALVIGLIVTMAMAGGVIAQAPFTWLTDNLGWRQTLLLDGLLGVIFIIIIAVFVRDYPPGYEKEKELHVGYLSEVGFRNSLRLTLTNKQNWLGGLYTSFLNLPIFLLGGLWGSLYLVQVHGFSRIDASFVTTMIFFGMIIGSPTLGWVSDRSGRRKLPMLISASLALIVILVIMYTPQLKLLPSLLLFLLLGFFISGQIISYPLIAESNPRALTGTAEGIASVLIMAGGITQPLFGWLMDLKWDGNMINQIPFYSVFAYRLAMGIMPIAFVLGLIAALLIRETYGQALEKVNQKQL